jgi:hypothetical protein
MCLRRAPEKYLTGAMAPVGAALDRAGLEPYRCTNHFNVHFLIPEKSIASEIICIFK